MQQRICIPYRVMTRYAEREQCPFKRIVCTQEAITTKCISLLRQKGAEAGCQLGNGMRDDVWETPYSDLYVFIERLGGNPNAPPEALQQLVWEHEAHLPMAANPSVTSEWLHLMVTDAADVGCVCWDVETVVAMHPLAAPGTLQTIAESLRHACPTTDHLIFEMDLRRYEPSIKTGWRGREIAGPGQVLLAVVCNRNTASTERRRCQDLIDEALELNGSKGGFSLAGFREDLANIMADHGALWDGAQERAQRFA